MRASIIILAALAGCSQAPEESGAPNAGQAVATVVPSPTSTPAAATPRDLTGRWIGVEGMYLIVTQATIAGRYRLEMQYDLDHKAFFRARATPDGLAFVRNGRRLTLRPTDGDATGLKYLAGKTDCLTVKPGEGYCRD